MRRESVVSKLLVAAVCVFAGAAMAQTGSFYTVNIRVPNGQYVTAEWGGERELVANRNTPSVWERFVLVDLTGGELNAGDAVLLRAQNGKYVGGQPGNGELHADRTTAGQWETLVIMKSNGQTGRIYSGDPVNLLAWEGRWISAVNGGGGAVRDDSVVAGAWELLRIDFQSRSTVDPSPLDSTWAAPIHYVTSIQAPTGHFFSAGQYGYQVKADRIAIGSWERFVLIDLNGGSLVSGDTVELRTHTGTHVSSWEASQGLYAPGTYNYYREVFRIHKAGGSGVINNFDQFHLEASDGRWVVAEGGGGGLVRANRTSVGPWETFRLWIQSTHAVDPSPLTP